MAKATTRHLCFTLNRSAVNFVTLENRKFKIINHTAENQHFSNSAIDQISYSYSSDFSVLFIEAKTILSLYDEDSLSTAIDNTFNYLNNTDWKTVLPEPLNDLYKLNTQSLPTKQKIIVEKEAINNLVFVKHCIEFNAKLSDIKSKVNSFLTKQIREPMFFTSLDIQGVKDNTIGYGKDLHINLNHNIAKVFQKGCNGSQETTFPRQEVIFKHKFLNFAHNSTDQSSGFMYIPKFYSEIAKLNLAFHTKIEMVLELKGQSFSCAACFVSPVIKKNRMLFDNLDLSEHLHCGLNKTEIKRAIQDKCVTGTKIIDLKITSMKRKVALSNYAKYQQITYIGFMFGYRVIAEINKDGSVKVSELDGGYFYCSNSKERLERAVKELLNDLFSNDREYASYLFYRMIYAKDTSNSHLLFS